MKLTVLVALMAAIFFLRMNITSAAPMEITDARATADYWTSRNPAGDEIILSAKKIASFNKMIRERDDYGADLANYPARISGADLAARIQRLTDDVNLDGTANRNLGAIPENVDVRYGVTIERVNVRLLPQAPSGDRYDSVQGTALDPAEAVAILWRSSDGKFLFVQARNYFGWVNSAQIALTNRENWQTYIAPENFLVVISNKKFVNVDGNGRLILFQMGAKIPLIDSALENNSWTSKIPVNVAGELKEVVVKIPNDEKVNFGWLDCTANNFVRQGFKFLGDVYGWGGLDNSVDCSSFVGDVYRSMGLEIPRDANWQESAMPIHAVFNNVSHKERVQIAREAPTGALFFKPGHVMMKLGNDDNNTPIIIHAASSYFSGGYKIYVRKVLVSDLNYEGAYVATIDGLTGIAVAK